MYLIFFSIGILLGFIYIVIKKSIHMPKPRTVQAIMLLGKLHTFITNIEGKTIYDGEDNFNAPGGPRKKWDLIDEGGTGGKRKNKYNIYFFLWPFFKVYKFPITYPVVKKRGEEREGDNIIWEKDGTKEIVVSRSNYSDHLEFRVEYPTITHRLNTKELAPIDTFSNNIIELTNPALALFKIKNWIGASMEILHGGLRTIVAERKLKNLNELSSSSTKSTFDESMKKIINDNSELEDHPSLESIGFKLFKSILKDFDASDDKSKELLDSYANVTIAKETGKAEVKLAKKRKKAKIIDAEGDAKSLGVKQKSIIRWRKRHLIRTGLAKTDSEGNITDLVPDANVRVGANALAELKSLTGTLVVNSEGLTKIVNLNEPTKLNK